MAERSAVSRLLARIGSTERPPTAARVVAALAAAAFALSLYRRGPWANGPHPNDFDHLWFAARVMLGGGDPYAAVGPGRAFDWQFPLYYPGTALVAVAPLAALPLAVARALFIATSAALLAFAVTRQGWWRLLILCSAPFQNAAMSGQWSPMVAASLLLAPLAFVAAVKPTVGVAALAASERDAPILVAVGTGLVLLAASLAIYPQWPLGWLAAVRDAPHISAPITHWRVGGPLVLLALARWRRPEARLLVALACVPQSTVIYEGLYFLLIPAGIGALVPMALGSFVASALQVRLAETAPSTVALQHGAGDLLVLFFYLPALLLIMRRPNEGRFPPLLARVTRLVGRRQPEGRTIARPDAS